MNSGEYKRFLGGKTYLTIESVRYHLSPHCYGGGCDLLGRVPRTDPIQQGGRTWMHARLTLRTDGQIECVGVIIGRLEAGEYQAYAEPKL